MGHLIRTAVLSDLKIVQHISESAYVPAYESVIGTVPKPAYEDYSARVKAEQVSIIGTEKKPFGLVVLETGDSSIAVYSIAVLPEHQRKGLGRELLRFAKNKAVEIGKERITLFTNSRMSRNVALYKSEGFIETGQREHPSRINEYLVDFEKFV